eukprot:GHRQ01017999.1.p2 GENE.GHRQ01017999.1~~GHRQ01017999.1.p2  ORF type:complete len:285 (+),score=175.06 GHRQ01017999.1:113-967(+)
MQQNPDMLKAAAQMMQSMPKEQLQAALAQAGLPAADIDPSMMAAAAQAMGNMTPQQMQQMAQMAQSAGQMRAAPAVAAGSSPALTSAAASSASGDSDAAPPAAAVAAAAPPAAAAGPVPGMPDMSAMMTPQMMQAASQMMANMKPEDFAAMSSMMGGMAAGGAPGAAGAGPEGVPAGMGDMLANMNPAMVEGMLTSLQAMDEDSLKEMMKGMCGGNEQQAAAMASQMKNMSPGQMRMVTKAAGVVQGGVQTARKARAWLAGNVMLVVAAVLLVVAILLRWFGIM